MNLQCTTTPLKGLSRDDWLQLRKQGIGGSHLAALIRDPSTGSPVSPWAGPLDVYLELTEDIKQPQTEAMARGHYLEEGVAQWWAADHGLELRDSEFCVSKQWPWMVGTPDRFVEPDAGLEIKTTSQWRADDWGENHGGAEDIPIYYLYQVYHYMIVTGLPTWHVTCLIGGDQRRDYTVYRDPEVFDAIVEIERRFWYDHIVPRVPPSMEHSRRYGMWLDQKYATSSGLCRAATPEEVALIEKLRDASRDYRTARGLLESAENDVKAAMGPAAALTSPAGTITWRPAKGRTTTNWEGLAREKGATDAEIKAHTTIGASERRFVKPRQWWSD